MNAKNTTKNLVRAALITAIYAALTYAASGLGIAYGPIQFRLSEGLTILAVFTPAAIPGLTIGCFLGNLGSPYGIVDVLCGTAATLAASIATYYIGKKVSKLVPVLAPLPPVIANAVIVGLEITLFLPEGASFLGFALSALEVGFGELVVCYGLGLPLYFALKKPHLRKYLFE